MVPIVQRKPDLQLVQQLYGIGGAGYLFNVRKGRTLPPELVDEIIDYLHHNIRALKACSLTHRTWLPRSRYHLFRALRFRKFGVDAFRLSSAPEIAQYVREVTVEGNMYSEVGKSILVDMGKVESLHLEASKIHFTDVHRGLCQSHLPVFPMLKELTLRKVYFRSFAEMISTIRSYRRLNSLTLDFEDWKYLAANAPDSSMVLALPSLKRLEMRHNLIGSWPGPIPQILLNSAGADLHDLTFDIVTSPSRPPRE